jgi:hypothetical protein
MCPGVLKLNYKGVCAIIYCDTNLQMELQSIGEAIMIGGPYWKRFEPVLKTTSAGTSAPISSGENLLYFRKLKINWALI